VWIIWSADESSGAVGLSWALERVGLLGFRKVYNCDFSGCAGAHGHGPWRGVRFVSSAMVWPASNRDRGL
jgi:hypothetical protein